MVLRNSEIGSGKSWRGSEIKGLRNGLAVVRLPIHSFFAFRFGSLRDRFIVLRSRDLAQHFIRNGKLRGKLQFLEDNILFGNECLYIRIFVVTLQIIYADRWKYNKT